MTFQIRPFARCIDAFAASRPNDTLQKQEVDSAFDHESTEVHAFEDINDADHPVTALFLQESPVEGELTDPELLVRYFPYCVVSTWNARGEAQWASGDGWIIAETSLTQEQRGPASHVDVLFALWRVEEGVAAAAFEPSQKELLREVMGLDAWPQGGFERAKVWYGE